MQNIRNEDTPLSAELAFVVRETVEEHLTQRHCSTTNNCTLELPNIGATMKFKQGSFHTTVYGRC